MKSLNLGGRIEFTPRSLKSTANHSLASFESDRPIIGQGVVDTMTSLISSTKAMDGAPGDSAAAPGEVDLHQEGVVVLRPYYEGAPETPLRTKSDQSVTFDTGTAKVSRFQQDWSSSETWPSGHESRVDVRRNFWIDDRGREHYSEQDSKSAMEVVIDRGLGTVAVLDF